MTKFKQLLKRPSPYQPSPTQTQQQVPDEETVGHFDRDTHFSDKGTLKSVPARFSSFLMK